MQATDKRQIAKQPINQPYHSIDGYLFANVTSVRRADAGAWEATGCARSIPHNSTFMALPVLQHGSRVPRGSARPTPAASHVTVPGALSQSGASTIWRCAGVAETFGRLCVVRWCVGTTRHGSAYPHHFVKRKTEKARWPHHARAHHPPRDSLCPSH